MRHLITIALILTTLFAACNTSAPLAKAPTTDTTPTQTEPLGAPTVGMSINIDGVLWQAETYGINQLGTFWLVKGTAADGSVFSIMLPDPLTTAQYTVGEGGTVNITYGPKNESKLVNVLPLSGKDGWVKTTLADGYLRGNLEVSVSNGGIPKKCTGMFSIKL